MCCELCQRAASARWQFAHVSLPTNEVAVSARAGVTFGKDVDTINPNTNEEINQTVPVNVVYDFSDVSNNAKPFFTILDSTVFSVRDLAIDNKYLVKDAVWGDMYIRDVQEEIKVTDYGKVSLKFGSFDSYIVSYKEGEKENKLWIVDNLPLPVKAEVYDLSGNLQYSYELTSLSAPLAPGFN